MKETIRIRSRRDPSVIGEAPAGTPFDPEEWEVVEAPGRAESPAQSATFLQRLGRSGGDLSEALASGRATAGDVYPATGARSKGARESGLTDRGIGSAVGGALGAATFGAPGLVGGSMAGEGVEQAVRGEFDPFQLAASGAIPATVSGGGRLGRGGADALKSGLRKLGLLADTPTRGGHVAVPKLEQTAQTLEGRVGNFPASAGMRKVGRELLDIQDRLTGPAATFGPGGASLPMEQVEHIRRGIGQVVQERGPQEARRLYGALMTDLRAASDQGVPGASDLLTRLREDAALKAFLPQGLAEKIAGGLTLGVTPLALGAGRLLLQTPGNPMREAGLSAGLQGLRRSGSLSDAQTAELLGQPVRR
jgi:hypothetical protein